MSKAGYDSGHLAEKRAAEFLKQQGFKITQLNWKNRYCEIDIIAQKDQTVYFVEVKFRKSAVFGESLEYVTKAKQGKMQFAAEFWVSTNDYEGNYQLAAVGIDGDQFTLVDID